KDNEDDDMEGVSSSNNNGSCGIMNKNNSNIENELNFINLTQNSDGDDDGKEDSNVKDIQTTATEIEKAADAKAININQTISETIDESQDIAHLNNVVEKYQFTIDKITRELDQLQLEMYNDKEEDDNEGKINQEDSIDDVVVLENIVEKDEEERQEIVSTTSIIMSTKDDNDSNDGDDLMDLTNNLNESTNTRCFYTKPPRYRPYNIALNEIRRHQRTTNLLLRRIPFSRVVEEIATNIFQQHSNMGFEFESTAITALQEAAETYLIELFQDA
ncbi:8551_t:CDS:2, partial [Entrophospora sp. SA101]